jgi:hypothetical protein
METTIMTAKLTAIQFLARQLYPIWEKHSKRAFLFLFKPRAPANAFMIRPVSAADLVRDLFAVQTAWPFVDLDAVNGRLEV